MKTRAPSGSARPGFIPASMKSCVAGLLLAAFLGTPLAVKAQQADAAFETCIAQMRVQADLARRAVSCGEVISRPGENPRKVAFAYAMRGWTQAAIPEAIADFSAALAIIPDLDPALAGRAGFYLNSGKSDLALVDYTNILGRHPDDVELLIGRGDALNNLKRYDEGIRDFDRALALQPDNEEALNDRAWALARQRRFAEAIAGYDRALAVAKRMKGMILANRCEAKSASGDLSGALADCGEAIATDAKISWYWSSRGLVHLKAAGSAAGGSEAGGSEAALADFDRALTLDPKASAAYFGRGILRLRSGDKLAGEEDLKKAEAIYPAIREEMAAQGIRP